MKRSSYVIGTGHERYEFPIVRTGNVRKPVATLYVNAESFKFALAYAICWSLDYSESVRATSRDGTEEFWPLLKRISTISDRRYEKVYAKRMSGESVYIEAKDYGCWLTIMALGIV